MWNTVVPVREWCVFCLCKQWQIRKNGVNVTENLKAIKANKALVKQFGWQEALDHYLEKNTHVEVLSE